MNRKSTRIGLLSTLIYLSAPAIAAIPEFKLIIKNNLFYPTELQVPADVKFRLTIDNQDNEPEEFDSFDLNREKVIFGKRSATIYLGPLKPGEYHYFGEYNPNTARGKIVVVDATASTSDTGGVNVN